MENFTSHYIGILKKKGILEHPITDGFKEVDTIFSETPVLPNNYKRPRIIYDKYSSDDEELLEPKIETVEKRLGLIKEIGFEIVSFSVNNGWKKNQRVEYKVIKKDRLSDDADSLSKVPDKHYVEIDKANRRIRICGPNCRNNNRIGATKWKSFAK